MTYSPVSLRRAIAWHPPLMLFAGTMAALAVVALAGLVVDDRELLGAPVWLKPFKFAVSFVAYAVTLAWMIPLLRRGRRTARWTGTVVAVAGILEVGLIVGQAARGRQSHFNNTTPLDEMILMGMAGMAGVLYLGTLVVAVLLMIQRVGEPAITWTLRLGVLIALAGMGVGFLMVLPTDAQLAAGTGDIVGAHSVGVPDGGAGMAVTGWSTTGGDLRISHFVGMHALQALPLLAIALAALAGRFPRLRDGRVRLRLVLVAAAGYSGLVALVTWQALRGQPLIDPDGATLAAAGLLAAATAVGAVAALRRRPPAPAPEAERIEVYR
ncbi:hypothetical protein [Plantactinospora sp. CA-290183]|uniref:hypothetical protein n=1 Tax=Plantactinospora sp. CA-290183 TaxID=3240006 RepID=UPI003D92B955